VGFLLWLEETPLADWVRTSAIGYPLMITSHGVGMAIMVGLALALSMRLLGAFRALPYSSLPSFLVIAWIGFGINFLSGAALFTTQATSYVTSTPFLIKIALVLAGAIAVGLQQATVGRDAAAVDGPPTAGVRLTAIASIVFWVGAIVTGRLIAYL
jgi:hypothetical protein